MSYHIHSLLIRRNSLWAAWIYSYRMKGKSIWDVRIPKSCCWGCRKILQCRPHVHQFFWSVIGNGRDTILWFDRWEDRCPLNDYVTPRQMAQNGLSITTKVADVIQNDQWMWPSQLVDKFAGSMWPNQVLIVNDKEDQHLWRNADGSICQFSIHNAWN